MILELKSSVDERPLAIPRLISAAVYSSGNQFPLFDSTSRASPRELCLPVSYPSLHFIPVPEFRKESPIDTGGIQLNIQGCSGSGERDIETRSKRGTNRAAPGRHGRLMQPETYTAKSLHASGATRETLPDDTGTLLFSARNAHSETNSLGIYAYMSLYVDVCVYIYIYIERIPRNDRNFRFGNFHQSHGAVSPRRFVAAMISRMPWQMLLKVYRPQNRDLVVCLRFSFRLDRQTVCSFNFFIATSIGILEQSDIRNISYTLTIRSYCDKKIFLNLSQFEKDRL